MKEAELNAARYRWLRENGDKGIFVILDGHLQLCQGAELDTVIDEYVSGIRSTPQSQTEPK